MKQKHPAVNVNSDNLNLNEEEDKSSKNSLQDTSKFVCSTCSASFVQEKSLKCHLKQHTTTVPSYPQLPPPKPIVISVIKNNINRLHNDNRPPQPARPQVITFADSNYVAANNHF